MDPQLRGRAAFNRTDDGRCDRVRLASTIAKAASPTTAGAAAKATVKVNTATDADLLKVPGLTTPVLAAIKKARPIASATRLHTALISVLPATQATAIEKYLSVWS